MMDGEILIDLPNPNDFPIDRELDHNEMMKILDEIVPVGAIGHTNLSGATTLPLEARFQEKYGYRFRPTKNPTILTGHRSSSFLTNNRLMALNGYQSVTMGDLLERMTERYILDGLMVSVTNDDVGSSLSRINRRPELLNGIYKNRFMETHADFVGSAEKTRVVKDLMKPMMEVFCLQLTTRDFRQGHVCPDAYRFEDMTSITSTPPYSEGLSKTSEKQGINRFTTLFDEVLREFTTTAGIQRLIDLQILEDTTLPLFFENVSKWQTMRAVQEIQKSKVRNLHFWTMTPYPLGEGQIYPDPRAIPSIIRATEKFTKGLITGEIRMTKTPNMGEEQLTELFTKMNEFAFTSFAVFRAKQNPSPGWYSDTLQEAQKALGDLKNYLANH